MRKEYRFFLLLFRQENNALMRWFFSFRITGQRSDHLLIHYGSRNLANGRMTTKMMATGVVALMETVEDRLIVFLQI